MEKNPSSADELKTIRKFMEESIKFLSLSGLSGVFPGIFALAGAFIAWLLILDKGNFTYEMYNSLPTEATAALRWKMILDALSVLLLSLTAAYYFSSRRAKKSGISFWTPASKRLLINLFIPLLTGGIFAFILLIRNDIQLIIPVFLIFYGLALISAGKFTFNEVFYLGILEIITGLISAFFPAHGLIFWILGFGILHIAYGLLVYRRYEA